MSKNEILRSVRGSFTSYEKLSEENIGTVAHGQIDYPTIKEIFEEAGLNVDNILVDPERAMWNMYYADYKSGLYFEVLPSEEILRNEDMGVKRYAQIRNRVSEFCDTGNWEAFYTICVPTPLQIWDFQQRVYDIPQEQVFDVWAEIYRGMDYANDQWKDEVLDYVFSHAPEPKLPPLNENGMVTVYRGVGELSQPPELALSWSSNLQNALWFANHTGLGQAVYEAEVEPTDVIAYFPGFQSENEVLVRKGCAGNIRALDMIPVSQENAQKLFAPAIPDLLEYGSQVNDLNYSSEGAFHYHGRKHVLRVLMLGLIYYYNSGDALTPRDKDIITNFALLHDIGRQNEDTDRDHGRRAAEMIKEDDLRIAGTRLGKKDSEMLQFVVKYHSLPDQEGLAAIAEKRNYSAKDIDRLTRLFHICKDIDGLDRVRFNGLDIRQLRTDYAKKLPLIAGCLLHEDIEKFVQEASLDMDEPDEAESFDMTMI